MTGNQSLAEGLCHHFCGDIIDAHSAGVEKHGLNALAVAVMQEIGIDISGHHSKNVDDSGNREFDYVITVCGHANETCPFFPAKTEVIHKGFDDPPKLAAGSANKQEALEHYRRVRDEIRDYIQALPLILNVEKHVPSTADSGC